MRIEGGTVNGEVIGYGTASVQMQGGLVAHILAYDDVTVSLRGGSVPGFLIAYQSSAMTIAGQGFAIDGVPVRSRHASTALGHAHRRIGVRRVFHQLPLPQRL